jgi:hypothetical protein
LLKSTGLYPGISDLHLLVKKDILIDGITIKYPTTIYLELKTESGHQSAAQKGWQKTVVDMGFEYVIIRSITEFKNIVTRYYE